MTRYRQEYELPDYDIEIITGSKTAGGSFEETTKLCGQPKKVSNWIMGNTAAA